MFFKENYTTNWKVFNFIKSMELMMGKIIFMIESAAR